MPLFLVVANDANDDNSDAFVRADNATIAVSMYQNSDLAHSVAGQVRVFSVPDAVGVREVVDWQEITVTEFSS